MIERLKAWLTRPKLDLKVQRAGAKTISIDDLIAGIPLSNFANWEDYLQAGSKKCWASFKSCDIIAKAVQATPFSITREGSTTPAKHAELERLFRFPNTEETFRDLLYKTIFHLHLAGMAFWYKSEANLNGDKPRELISLNPKRMKIVPDGLNGIAGYVLKVKGNSIPFDASEVMFFKRPHPNHDLYGLGDIEGGSSAVNEHINRVKMSESYFTRGGVPSGIMINKKDSLISPEEWMKIKAQWAAEYGGAENAGKTAWLMGDWEYKQLGLSLAEMQQLEAAKVNVEQIFLLHGVPLSVAGIREAANYATADIDNARFKEYTILPDVQLLQDTINTDLVDGFDTRLQLRYSVVGLIDVGKITQQYGPAFDRGWVTINEARAAMGLPTDPDNPAWNQSYINAGMVPLDLSGIADLGATDRAAQRTVQRFVDKILTPEEANGRH